MDLTYLPEIFSFLIVTGCFRPLVRRAGPHVNLWFVGFVFLAGHLTAAIFRPDVQSAPSFALLASRWMIDLAVLTLLLACANRTQERLSRFDLRLLAAAVLTQSTFASLARHPWPVSGSLFAVPALVLLLGPGRRRSRDLFPLATCCILLAAASWLVPPVEAVLFSRAVVTVLLLNAAWLYARSLKRVTRSGIAVVGGLIGWGLMNPAILLIRQFHPGFRPTRGLFELPVFVACGGILLDLLEEHILRAERMAMHDPLTDLPNRRLFDERLAAALEEARAQGTTLACLVIDVDNFKQVNDTLGHNAGDQLLRALAVRLSWHMGPRDLLARTGGDEFTAMLAGVYSADHLRFVASAMMSAAAVPILIDDEKEVDMRISIGIAMSPHHADDIESLRRAADDAMYSAKRRGGSLLAVAGEE